jgi:hypothetical protein
LHLIAAWFDLDPFPETREKHPVAESVIEETTAFISRSGIHASNPDFNVFESQSAAAALKNTSRKKFFISKLFPNYITMKGMYPYIGKLPLLLPVGWMHRGFSKLFTDRKNTLRKLKSANVDTETRNSVTGLYKKLGL